MRILLTTALALATVTTSTAWANPNALWAVEASATGSGVSNSAYAELFDTSGNPLSPAFRLGSGFSPGGVALAGNTLYVSSTTDGTIRTFNTTTRTAGAVITTGQPALGSLSADATGLWGNDYGGGNKALHFTFAGVNDKTVTLANCGSFCNGIEAFTRGGQSFLIANRGETEASATYDLYSSTGALVTAALIANVPNGSGITYNGTGFYVADALDFTLLSYTATGALLSTAAFGGPAPDSGFGNSRFVTDLAFAVPEPMSLPLLSVGLGAAGWVRRRV